MENTSFDSSYQPIDLDHFCDESPNIKLYMPESDKKKSEVTKSKAEVILNIRKDVSQENSNINNIVKDNKKGKH
jgi:hypothetical protein